MSELYFIHALRSSKTFLLEAISNLGKSKYYWHKYFDSTSIVSTIKRKKDFCNGVRKEKKWKCRFWIKSLVARMYAFLCVSVLPLQY